MSITSSIISSKYIQVLHDAISVSSINIAGICVQVIITSYGKYVATSYKGKLQELNPCDYIERK